MGQKEYTALESKPIIFFDEAIESENSALIEKVQNMEGGASSQRRWFDGLYYLFASFILLLGCVVILGWYIQSPVLVQIVPTFAPMQYNTALGFLLSALGLLCINKFSRLSVSFGVILLICSFATFLQYLIHADFGIDNLFIDHFTMVHTSHVGRMAPNTALCFMITGFVLSLTSVSKYVRMINIQMIGAFVVFILALTAFFGYITGVNDAYGWSNLTRMALHTTTGFLVVSSCLIAHFWSKSSIVHYRRGRYVPLLVFLIGGAIVVLFWSALITSQKQLKQRQISIQAQAVSGKVAVQLEEEIEALKRLFDRAHTDSYFTKTALEQDMHNYLKHMPALLAIEAKPDKRLGLPGMFLKHQASMTQVSISDIIQTCHNLLASDVHFGRIGALKVVGTVGYLCVGDTRNNGVAIIDLHQLLQAIYPKFFNEKQVQLTINQGSVPLYQNQAQLQSTSRVFSKEVAINIFGLHWQMKLNLPIGVVEGFTSPLAWVFLILGLAVVGAIALVFALWQSGQQKLNLLSLSLKQNQESEVLLSSIIESVAEAIFIIDASGKIWGVNSQSEELSGYNVKKLTHMPIERLLVASMDNKKRNWLKDYQEKSVNYQLNHKCQLSLVTKKKDFIPVEVVLAPITVRAEAHVLVCVRDLR